AARTHCESACEPACHACEPEPEPNSEREPYFSSKRAQTTTTPGNIPDCCPTFPRTPGSRPKSVGTTPWEPSPDTRAGIGTDTGDSQRCPATGPLPGCGH